MSKSEELQLETLSASLAEMYYIEKERDKALHFIEDYVTCFDSDSGKIYRSKKEINDLLEYSRGYGEQSQLEILLVECLHATVTTGIVMQKLKSRSSVEGYDTVICLSLMWNKDRSGLWKIHYIHRSVQRDTTMKCSDMGIDQMTMINNLEGFVEKVSTILKRNPNQRYAIIKFGIKDFRYINGRHGYRKGDKVLQNIAKNLQSTCTHEETCGRIEKDTFAMLYRFEGKCAMDKRMNNVKEQLIDDLLLHELGMEVNYIAGIYIVPKEDKEHVKNMLDKALLAMQRAGNRHQGSHYLYYEKQMMERQYMNSQILERAGYAMKHEEFQLYIQPQFDVKNGKVVAGEALCRWEKEKGKFIPPNEFIPLFEEHGLILDFDFYMLEKLCQKMKQWICSGRILSPISVNQSRLHLENDDYIENFCKIVDSYSIPHDYIAFELTESAFVDQNEKMTELARELHERGFQLAIDDFGTGYASLNLLSIISADILKVDKSLIDSIHTKRGRAVLEKVIELAHQMDMMVICEGIEHMEQLEQLRKLNCDVAQGFLMGRPVPALDFEKIWIRRSEKK